MTDVEAALARVAARRHPAEGHRATVPPAPHFAVRPSPEMVAWPDVVLALESEHAGRFDALADGLIEARERRGCRSLLFVSCHRAEGRTTLAMLAARALGRRPGRTALIDADLSGPTLRKLLVGDLRNGLDDAVSEGVALSDALVDIPDANLSLLPLRAPVPRPHEFLTSAGWMTAMSRLRRDFDSILLDGGPLFPGLAGRAAIPEADTAILCYRPGLTSERALVRARSLLEREGIPLLGLAETFA